MYEVRTLGEAHLELFTQLADQIAFSDFCASAGTIDFFASDGFLQNNIVLFRLSFPGYDLEARIHDGMVYVRRNGLYQHSTAYLGAERVHVAVQWSVDSIGCGVATADEDMNHCMRAVRTPVTVPPRELIRTLRTSNLLFNSAYRSSDDLFISVLDCLHLCQVDIRRHGGERFIWGKNGDLSRPFDEPEISRYVATFLSAHGAARNFDVSCESRAGNGNVDFWVVGPVHGAGLAKIAIEAKKADHKGYVQGFSTQLPTYMARLEASHGIFLTYWLKSATYPHPRQATYAELEIDVLHPLSRGSGVRTVALDLSNGPRPSEA